MAITEELGRSAPRAEAAARTPARADDASPAAEPRPRDGIRDRGRWATWAVVLVAISPLLVGAVQILRRGFPPGSLFGDRAILALTAGDAFRAPVLLGPYSRFFWHHPGPFYFYVLDAWSRAFGHSTVALVLGATAINVAGALGVLFLAHRRGGRPLLVWTALLLTAYLVAIEPIPFDIWNPSVTLLPFVALLLLAWSVTCRDWWAMPWFALIASFVVQTHVGLAPPVSMAAAFCIAVVWWQHRRAPEPVSAGERHTMSVAALVALAVGVVAWIPPFVQEATGRDGNLSDLFNFFTKGSDPHPLTDGLTHTGLQATLMVRSLFEPISLRNDLHQGLAVGLAVTGIAFVAGVVLARRAGDRPAQLLLGLVVLELAAAVYAVSRIVGPIQFYLVQWVSAVGFVLWIAVGHAVIAAARDRFTVRPPSRTAVRVGLVLVALLLVGGAVRAIPSGAGLVNQDLDVPNNRALFGYVPTQQLLDATRHGETVVMRSDSITAWEVLAADALLLRQHGRTVEVVETPSTRLLFDESILVPAADGKPAAGRVVLAFRDRKQRPLAGARFVADQGLWAIETVGSR